MEDAILSGPSSATKAEELEIHIEEPSSVVRKVTVSIPESRIKDKFDTVLKTLVKDAALPGFRKGRVPRRLLEKRFKADIANDVRSQIISESLSEAIEDNGLQPLSEPKFDPEMPEVPEVGAMKFAVEFEVLPEFSLPDLSAVELKKPALAVTDERMNLAKDHLLGNLAEMREVPEIGDADDHISTDVVLTDQSGTLIENFPDQHLHFRPKYNFAGFELNDFDSRVRGAKVGDTVRFEVTFPATFKREDLRGQNATLGFHITKITRRVKPELTDDLAKANGFDGLEDLNESLRRAIDDRLKSEAARLLREQAAEKLREMVQIDIPPSLVQRVAAQLAQSVMRQAEQSGHKLELNPDMIARLRTSAEPRAKLDAIVMRLAEKFGMDVQNEEVNAEVAMMADMNGMRPELLLSRMNKAGQLDSLRTELLHRKVLDRVVEQCKTLEIDEAQWKREQDELRASMEEQAAKAAESTGQAEVPQA